MNKKLLAVAVAGALAAPVAAFAQSSVTVTGILKASLDHQKISGVNATRTGNTSETRVTDHSSRIIFNVVEDMGGGLQAVGQFDLRFALDAQNRINLATAAGAAGTSPTPNPVSGGNNHIGLVSKAFGAVRVGRNDVHYGHSGDNIATKGALWAHNSALFDSVARPGTTNNAIAGTTRTPNLIWYNSPNWSGFKLLAGYSTNPMVVSGTVSVENDMGTNGRAGRAYLFNPSFDTKQAHVSWSHWNAKSDWMGATASNAAVTEAAANANNDQKSNSIRGHYDFPMGLRIGLGYNSSKVSEAVTGLVRGNRTAWALPVSYTTGPHTLNATYTKAGDSKDLSAGTSGTAGTAVAAASGSQTGARLLALNYSYDLSKRTSASVTYAKLNNRASGVYTLFYVADTVMGGASTTALAGEDHRMMGVVLRHTF